MEKLHKKKEKVNTASSNCFLKWGWGNTLWWERRTGYSSCEDRKWTSIFLSNTYGQLYVLTKLKRWTMREIHERMWVDREWFLLLMWLFTEKKRHNSKGILKDVQFLANKLISYANQLTGFYMTAILAFNELRTIHLQKLGAVWQGQCKIMVGNKHFEQRRKNKEVGQATMGAHIHGR